MDLFSMDKKKFTFIFHNKNCHMHLKNFFDDLTRGFDQILIMNKNSLGLTPLISLHKFPAGPLFDFQCPKFCTMPHCASNSEFP
ncbi:hypothetical protein BpHYR1_019380 [Brachionus plicatilis]|uniref:Uncharacterized protein n=1 Tax=Brachionus plicatilis TaxID=10195 RepID=A0A3M7PNL4_BRAPC|nr:hypothetical protein BpHYR1_019380 [Brachionus plicatilis]